MFGIKEKNTGINKQRRINGKIIKLVMICLGLILLCFIIFGIHMQKVVSTYRRLVYDSIYSQTEMGAEIIARTFSRNGEMISTEAEEFGRKGDISYSAIRAMIQNVNRKELFERIFYVSEQGTVHNVKGDISKISSKKMNSDLKTEALYEIYLDRQYFGKGIRTFSVVAPVRINGIIKGYLVGTDSTDKLMEGLSSDYISAVSECYIMDNNGVIIASMRHNETTEHVGRNFFDDIYAEMRDQDEAAEFEKNFQIGLAAGNTSSMRVSLSGDNIDLFYAKIPDGDKWNLVYCVSENAIDEQVWSVNFEAICTGIAIMTIMLLLCMAVWEYVKEDQNQIEKLAYEDSLTGAPNENYFKIRAAELLKDNHETPYVITCYDIVNFRYINEAYGHEKADAVLKAMASAAKESFSYNETFARLSADTFISLAVNDGRQAERKRFMENRLSEAARAIYISYPVKIKRGYYTVTENRENISDMIDKANLARKAIDATSKTLDAEYEERLTEDTRHREYIESKMEQALENGEFVPFLQPKWNMVENKISGAEALVRWKKTSGEIIAPDEFIPTFEKNGFIEKIDFFMLEEICRYLRKLIDEKKQVFPVSINQSRYLMYNPEYIAHVQEILLKYKIPSGLVELELTETVFFQEKERMLIVMQQLKELNMELSIDDFGSGYSSLNLLHDIPFDVIKIDRGFLSKSTENESGKWILRKIVEMADGLGVRVICEGVETQEQVTMLLEIGCIYAQGYLYSRPIPIEEFIEKYNLEETDTLECES